MTEAYNEFNNVAKLMNKTSISTNTDTLNRYRASIIPAYNKFVQFIDANYNRVRQSDQYLLDNSLEKVRGIFIKCLDNLKCNYELPNDLLECVSEQSIGPIGIEVVVPAASTSKADTVDQKIITVNVDNSSIDDNNENTNGRDNANNIENRDENGVNNNNRENDNNDNDTDDYQSGNDDENNDDDDNSSNQTDSEIGSEDEKNMEMTTIELFNAVNRQFGQKYSGDPLGLTSFIDGVDIVTDFATTPALRASLLKYIKSKLDGRAREFVTVDVDTIDKLKDALINNIVPENSRVIEGRILSLRYAYSRQEEFTARAEELADALRRTLIIEGMTAAKASEISIDKTVQLCRKSTNSDLVKSVLASTAFKSPKDVIAKLITESDTHVKEQQILRFQKLNRGNGNQSGKRGRSGNGGKHNGQNNNSNNSNNSNGGNGRGRNNGNGNCRGRGSGNRGRGNGRQNNGPGSNYNGYSQNQYHNQYQDNRNNGGPNIRMAHSGNEQVPQQMTMGAPMNQNFQHFQY